MPIAACVRKLLPFYLHMHAATSLLWRPTVVEPPRADPAVLWYLKQNRRLEAGCPQCGPMVSSLSAVAEALGAHHVCAT